jgi:hypothetical protein
VVTRAWLAGSVKGDAAPSRRWWLGEA